MAQNKMLIDASHSEETRVAVVRGNKVEEFDFESSDKRQLRGNIYLAKVTRVEPSLQAAFVDYGGNRHGFLAFSEIHPDYYQIPVADRQALLDEEAQEAAELEEEEDELVEDALEVDVEADTEVATETETETTDGDVDSQVVASAEEEKPNARRRNTRRRKPKVEAVAEAKPAENETSSNDEDDELPPFLAAMVEDDNSISEPVADSEEEKPAPKRRGRPKKVKAEAVEETKTEEVVAEVQQAIETVEEVKLTETDDAAKPAETTEEAKPAEATEGAVTAEPVEATEPTQSGNAETSEETSDDESQTKRPRRRRTHRRRTRGKKVEQDPTEENSEADSDSSSDTAVDVVGVEDALEEVPARRPKRRNYKIQEVIKRRQVILVQIVKEERGNKGAALTTYLSLAGRYSVLMPNTARGGGISRKITNAADRKRLKAIASSLDVAKGMGVILRTAGANLNQDDIKRDFEYLLRLWENVRQLTLQSTAPCLVYEEGSLIKRSIRDLYNKDISEIHVAGEEGFKEAKEFMAMLMPSNARHVKLHRGSQPLFARYDVESQLDKMLQPHVTMKSGGYLVINQTEALVAIDINSGRSTKEHSIEDTALQTNLEAADEIARQLRLRDLAGLIVIDFIDMEENRNNRAVEKRLKEALKTDRARIQVGRISHFGLLEMSRQRMRASVLDSTTLVCPTCEGAGHVRSPSSIALHVLRALEQHLTNNSRNNITVKCSAETALFMLNQKRESLTELEGRYGVTMNIEIDSNVTTEFLEIIRGEPAQRRVPAPEHVQMDYQAIDEVEEVSDDSTSHPNAQADVQTNVQANTKDDEDGEGNKRRRRRRRRGNRNQQDDVQNNEQQNVEQSETEAPVENADVQSGEANNAPSDVKTDEDDDKRKRRRRGKRGGRKHKQNTEQADTDASPKPDGEDGAEAVTETVAETTSVAEVNAEPAKTETVQTEPTQAEPAKVTAAAPERKKRRTKEEIEADKIAKAAEREAAKLARAAEREAAKAAKAAEKEAEKAARAAEREAAKAVKAAEKAAAKEAENEAKSSKTRRSAPTSAESEIVITSEASAATENAPEKPAKAGWWRRKS